MDYHVYPLWLSAVFVCLAPLIGLLLFGTRRDLHVGPLPEGSVRSGLESRLRYRHGVAAGTVAIGGAVSVEPASIIICLLIGLLVAVTLGRWWAYQRLAGLVVASAGPDPSTPEERLFPSDAISRLFRSGSAKPLPLWTDLLMLVSASLLGSALSVMVQLFLV